MSDQVFCGGPAAQVRLARLLGTTALVAVGVLAAAPVGARAQTQTFSTAGPHGDITVNSPTVLTVTSGVTATVTGTVTGGASTLGVSGPGVLVLDNTANSWAGVTTINSGATLRGRSDTINSGPIVNNWNLDFVQSGSGTFSRNVSGSGAINVSGLSAGNTLTFSGTLTNRNGIAAGAGGRVGISSTGSMSITSAGWSAVSLSGVGASLTNAGTVSTDGSSQISTIRLNLSGVITNSATGRIVRDGAGEAIRAAAGASLTLDNAGEIESTTGVGVFMLGGGTITNSGSITAESKAVEFYSGASGTVTNQTGGSIVSISGQAITGNEAFTVDNAGEIKGLTEAVNMTGSSGVTNRAGGVISNNDYGSTLYNRGADGTTTITNEAGGTINSLMATIETYNVLVLDNAGIIEGGDGVWTAGGGAITNRAGAEIRATDGVGYGLWNLGGNALTVDNAGLIEGGDLGIGVWDDSKTTVTSSGTIRGANGAISMSSADDSVTLLAGSVTDGAVRMADGKDVIDIRTGASVTGDVAGDEGDDEITIGAATITGFVTGGDGADRITITGATLSQRVEGGADADEITIEGGSIAGVRGDDGADILTIKTGTAVTGDISGGAGDDAITLGAGLNISGGSVGGNDGSDTITLLGSVTTTYGIYGGTDSGSDTLVLGGTGTASIDFSHFAEFETLTKSGAGTWTLTGNAAPDGSITINAGTGAPAGTLVFQNTSGLARPINVNGATIRAASAGGFGSGAIHAIDPRIEFGATGTYTNPISLEVASPATSSPTTLAADGGVTATLSGAITRGAGDAAQPLVIGGTGTIYLTSIGNSWAGVTTIDAGATLQGGSRTISGGSIVNNGTLNYLQTSNNTASQAISGTGSFIKTGSSNLTLGGAGTWTGTTTISAGTLTGTAATIGGSSVVNNATLVFDQASAATFDKAISGTGAVTKSGAGNLTLTGAGSWDGTTSISDGTLTATAASLGGAGVTNNASLVFDQATDATSSKAISGSGAVTKTGAGNLTLSGAGSWSGVTTVSAGTLTGSATAIGGSSIVNNATLAYDQASAASVSKAISGSGDFVKLGVGNLTLSGAGTWTGMTTISAGTLTASAASLGGASVINDAALVFDQGVDATFGKSISGVGSVTKAGAGALTLTGTGSWAGTTTISGGTLTSSLAGLGGSSMINNGGLVLSQAGSGTFSKAVSGTGGVTITGLASGEALTFAGALTNSGGLVGGANGRIGVASTGSVAPGAGPAVTLSGGGSSLSNAGTLTTTGGDGLWTVRLDTSATVANSGVIRRVGAGNNYAIRGGASASLTLNNLSGGQILSADAAGVFTQAPSSITNAGTISAKTNAVTFFGGGDGSVLTNQTGGVVSSVQGVGVASYDRATVDNTGTISGFDGVYLARGGSVINRAGGTIIGSNTGFTALGPFTLDNAGAITGPYGVSRVYGGAATITSSGTITGTTQAISLQGVYNDTVTLAAGSVTNGDVYLGDGDDTLTLVDDAVLNGNVEGGGGFDSLILNGAGSQSITGNITGVDNFTKIGAGDWSLIGATTLGSVDIQAGTGTPSGTLIFQDTGGITNDIIVNGATIRAKTAGGFGSGTIHMVDPTAQFSATGTYGNTISLEVAAPATADPTTLVADTGVIATLTGSITRGAGDIAQPLVIGGAGVIVLTNAANSWAGATTVNTGATLQGTSASISGGSIINNGRLGFDQAAAGTFTKAISGSGSLIKSGAGNLTLQGAGTWTGTTTISAGTLTASSASLGGSAVVNNASLVVDQATDGTLNQTISGLGGFTKTGVGNLTLAGTGGWAGTTTISAGTLSGGVASIGGSDIVNNGTLALSEATSAEFAKAVSGSGAIRVSGLNTGESLTFSAALSHAGGVIAGANGRVTIGSTGSINASGGTAVLLDGIGASIDNRGTLTTANTGESWTVALNTSGSVANAGVISRTGSATGYAIRGAYGASLALENKAGGEISNTGYGGVFTLANSSIVNAGLISSKGAAVTFYTGGGTLTNSGTITSMDASGLVSFDPASADNSGTISGFDGVYLLGGGTLTNRAGGMITGTNTAFTGLGAFTLENAGTISGPYGVSRVYGGAATIISSGAISGTTSAIHLQGAYDDSVALMGGSVTTGGIYLGDGDDRLTLSGALTLSGGVAGGRGSDSLVLEGSGAQNLTGQITGVESVTKNGSGTITLTGDATWDAVTTVSGGTLQGTTGSLGGARFVNDATLALAQNVSGEFTRDVSGSGVVAVSGQGADQMITLSGDLTNAGGLVAGVDGHLDIAAAGSVVVGSGAAVRLDGTGASLVSRGDITGDIGVARISTGGAALIRTFGTINATGKAIDLAGTHDDVVVLEAGSRTTGDVYLGDGDDRLTLVDSATLVGSVDGGAGSDTLVLDGAGVQSITGDILGFEEFRKTGAGTWTLIGATTLGTSPIEAGTGSPAGTLVFKDTAQITNDIIVNGATIRAETAGAFGSGTIHMIDPTAQFSATGTYANNISLEVVAPATADPATLVADAGVTATLSGAITRGAGDPVQPLVIAGTGRIVLTNAGNLWTGATTVSAGAILQGTAATISGGAIVDNGALVYDQASAGTVSQAISGSGAVNKTGGGTLTLAGAGGWTGTTTISAGTLIGTTATVGGGSVINNASLIYDQSASGSVAKVVSGTGFLTKRGMGVVTLTAANTYTGATTIENGTLAVSGSGSLAASQGLTITAGTFDISGAATGASVARLNGAGAVTLGARTLTVTNGAGTYMGAISGSGGLTLAAGSQTLSGVSSYTGRTRVLAGTLTLAGAVPTIGSSALEVSSGAAVVLGSNQSVAGLSGAGTLNLAANTLTFGGDNASTGFAGNIGGTGGLIKVGTGVFTLTGTHSYTGATMVSGGTFVADGEAAGSTISVGPGAMLKGAGRIGGLTVGSGGAVAPGNGIGTLTVPGDVFFAAGSTYQVETNGAGSADRITALGTARLGGAVEVLAQPGVYGPETDYTILSAMGGVTGQFTGATSNLAFLTPVISYTPDEVKLRLVNNGVFFDTYGQTDNQKTVARALNGGPTSGALYTAIVSQTKDSIAASYDAVSGEAHASALTILADQGHRARGGVLARLAEPANGGVSVWGRVGEQATRIDGQDGGNTAQVVSGATTLTFGADGDLGAWRLGIAASQDRGEIETPGRGGRFDSDTARVAIYLGTTNALGPNARFGVSQGRVFVDGRRSVVFPGLASVNTAAYDASVGEAFGEIGYRATLGSATLEPFASLATTRLAADAFSETGAAATLDVDARSIRTLSTEVGLRASGEVQVSSRTTLRPYGAVAWQHVETTGEAALRARFQAGGPDFTARGAAPDHDAAGIEAGVAAEFGKTAVAVGYNGDLGDGWQSYQVKLSARRAF